MARTMAEIAQLLKNTTFKRQLLGGVDEDDVWKKLNRLQAEYEALLEAERQQNLGVVKRLEQMLRTLRGDVAKRDLLIKKLYAELSAAKRSDA